MIDLEFISDYLKMYRESHGSGKPSAQEVAVAYVDTDPDAMQEGETFDVAVQRVKRQMKYYL